MAKESTSITPIIVLKGLIALLAGALVPAMIVVLIFTFIILWAPSGYYDVPVDPDVFAPYILPAGMLVLLLTFVITAAHAIIMGVPLGLVFLRFRLIHWWTSLLGGFVIGLLPISIVLWSRPLDALTIGGGLGAVGGITAWLMWTLLTWRPRVAAPPMPDGQLAEPPASL